jgi:hypothetical protein
VSITGSSAIYLSQFDKLERKMEKKGSNPIEEANPALWAKL